MPILLLPLFASLVQAAATVPAPAAAIAPERSISSRRGGRLFISPMGEPFRPSGREDDALADWFRQADRNHDGRLTIEEMQQDAERFFALLDVNHDGEIDPDEITRYEEVVAPEIRTGEHFGLSAFDSDDPKGGEPGGRGRGGGHHRSGGGDEGGRGFFRSIDTDQHQGAGRFGLLDLPEPVISADTDFDRGVSLNEFRIASQQRFLALDLDHKGYLTLDVLETIRPAPPAAPKAPEQSRQPTEEALPPGT